MNSAADRNRASALTKLPRAELRDARFSVPHPAPTNTEFRPNEFGGGTSSDLEEIFKEGLDARGLKALHQEGVWKQHWFRSNVGVKAPTRGLESTTCLQELQRLLDALEVLSDGHVARALGSILRTPYRSTGLQSDFPDKTIGVSETSEPWSYLRVDTCLTTPRRTAAMVLRRARGTRLPPP